MEDVNFGVKVDVTQLENALELANQLKEALKEVSQLINSISIDRAENDTSYVPFERRPY